jgi:TetR/AcrR family transcriptional regulator
MTASQLRRTRAVAPEAKSEKRAAIVNAVHELARRDLSASYSVEQLAKRAGVAKGTVYLYFKTREEMLLAVHEKQAHGLFDVVERALAAPDASAEKVVRAGLRYLKAHPEFYPLAAGCRGMLDKSVSTEAAFAFKVGIGRRLEPLGGRIEQLYPGLKRGEGAVLLMNNYAMIVGLWQLADPPLSLRPVMHRPEMQLFKLDFERQLSAALLDLWEAAARRTP